MAFLYLIKFFFNKKNQIKDFYKIIYEFYLQKFVYKEEYASKRRQSKQPIFVFSNENKIHILFTFGLRISKTI